MRVSIDNLKVREIKKDLNCINEWWNASTEELYSTERLIYCVEINGNSIYNNYEHFIIENYQEITEINIKSLSKNESIEETCKTLNDYLVRFIPATLVIADYFYSDVTEAQWSEFSEFIDGLSWIVKSIDFLRLLTSDSTSQLFVFNDFEKAISELEQGLEAKDYVLVADIMRYELVLQLEQLKERINGEPRK